MSNYLQNHTVTELSLSTTVKYSVPRTPPGTNDTEITNMPALSQRNYNFGLGGDTLVIYQDCQEDL